MRGEPTVPQSEALLMLEQGLTFEEAWSLCERSAAVAPSPWRKRATGIFKENRGGSWLERNSWNTKLSSFSTVKTLNERDINRPDTMNGRSQAMWANQRVVYWYGFTMMNTSCCWVEVVASISVLETLHPLRILQVKRLEESGVPHPFDPNGGSCSHALGLLGMYVSGASTQRSVSFRKKQESAR